MNTRTLLPLLLSAAICLAIAPCASAQRARTSKKEGSAVSIYLFLLFRKDVQTELKIDESQLAELAMTSQICESNGVAVTPSSTNEMWRADSQVLTELQGVLRDEQIHRLKELVVQFLGLEVLYSVDVQKSIGLVGNQREEAITILDGLFKQRTTFMAAGLDEDTLQSKLKSLDAETRDALGALLSSDQLAMLKTLAGAPFRSKEK